MYYVGTWTLRDCGRAAGGRPLDVAKAADVGEASWMDGMPGREALKRALADVEEEPKSASDVFASSVCYRFLRCRASGTGARKAAVK